MTYEEMFKKLVKLANKRGFKVRQSDSFDEGGMILLGYREIRIYKSLDPKLKAIILLHELGHAELFLEQDPDHIDFMLAMILWPEVKVERSRYKNFKRMERKAWHRGLDIAKREGLNIDIPSYKAQMKSGLASYNNAAFDEFFENIN